ncbi:MAG TPA: AGE family epimerase/isomerase [Bacteroidales bacterium]|nr:AGE family epimerase/isomerase [Bacteroidales bacterium]
MTRASEQILNELAGDARNELIGSILPFWITRMPDSVHGGFYGRINGENNTVSDAPKGAILNARILWTFSAALRELKDPLYLETALRAKDYIFKHFFDDEYGGTYWCLKSNGEPLDTKKQVYSQAFFIYALSEYYMATGDEECLKKAVELFHIIEDHSFDKELNGYLEAFDRQWGEIADLRLSEKDANEKKTMNTHLHILEAYTNLFRIWPDDKLRDQLRNLVNIFLNRIVDGSNSHLNLFFDEQWNCRSTLVSYGHDIEASWLLYEAAEVLNDSNLTAVVKEKAIKILKAAGEGLQADGSLIYERDNAVGHIDRDRHWWVQAEAVVGFLNAFELTGDEDYLLKSSKCYNYIKNNLVDRVGGEWYWSIKSDGTVNKTDDKAGFWKCPYHNSRMCLEIMARSMEHGAWTWVQDNL